MFPVERLCEQIFPLLAGGAKARRFSCDDISSLPSRSGDFVIFLKSSSPLFKSSTFITFTSGVVVEEIGNFLDDPEKPRESSFSSSPEILLKAQVHFVYIAILKF